VFFFKNEKKKKEKKRKEKKRKEKKRKEKKRKEKNRKEQKRKEQKRNRKARMRKEEKGKDLTQKKRLVLGLLLLEGSRKEGEPKKKNLVPQQRASFPLGCALLLPCIGFPLREP